MPTGLSQMTVRINGALLNFIAGRGVNVRVYDGLLELYRSARIARHFDRRMILVGMGLSLAGIQRNGSARTKCVLSPLSNNGATQWQANSSVIPSRSACRLRSGYCT